MANDSLGKARLAKNDEFYTQWAVGLIAPWRCSVMSRWHLG